jgi:hypothetical protein
VMGTGRDGDVARLSRFFPRNPDEVGQPETSLGRQGLPPQDSVADNGGGDLESSSGGCDRQSETLNGAPTGHGTGVGCKPAPAPAGQFYRGHAPHGCHPCKENRERSWFEMADRGPYGRGGISEHLLNKVTASEDPLVRRPAFTPTPQGLDGRLATSAAD